VKIGGMKRPPRNEPVGSGTGVAGERSGQFFLQQVFLSLYGGNVLTGLINSGIPREECNPIIRRNGIRNILKERFKVC
jgi:hypothetical protein